MYDPRHRRRERESSPARQRSRRRSWQTMRKETFAVNHNAQDSCAPAVEGFRALLRSAFCVRMLVIRALPHGCRGGAFRVWRARGIPNSVRWLRATCGFILGALESSRVSLWGALGNSMALDLGVFRVPLTTFGCGCRCLLEVPWPLVWHWLWVSFGCAWKCLGQ